MVVKTKNGGHFTRFKSKHQAKLQLKTWQEQQEQNSKGDFCYLENICGVEKPQTCTIEGELNIDGSKHVLAMFLNKELF